MHMGDFFHEQTRTLPGWGTELTEEVLDETLLRRIRSGPIDGRADQEVATALNRLVRTELEKRATDATQKLDEGGIELAQKTLKTVLWRLGISFDLPWRNFEEFRAYWMERGLTGFGSWQARRDLLTDFFQPILAELDRLEEIQDRGQVATAVSPHTELGWPEVDREVEALRQRFRSAQSAADYRDVGNRSVAVLEALSRTLYDPQKHLREGESEPPIDKTAIRLGRYVEDSLAGRDHEDVRGVVKKTSDLAHKVKHRPAATRRDAGIAADAAVMLANILRRVDQEL